MEESKELQGFYKIFRSVIYISILMEFFEYAIDPAMLDHWGGILCDIHGRIKRWVIYNDGNLAYSKLATFLLICITCIGTRNKKKLEFNGHKQVLYPIIAGIGLIVLSVWLYGYPMETRLYSLRLNIWLYMIASVVGVILVHIALDNISKFLKEGLLKDRFNFENESFEQCRELQENKYSVNIPMRYYYKGKFRKGWVNINNPFRGTWVVGTPGSGKTFSIIEPFIRQHSAKGFALVVYDYKFPTLASKLYYHYKKNQKLGKLPKGCKFNIINFVDVEYSRRVNPIQLKYINNLAAASETAETLLESLQKGKKEGGGGSDQFFQTSAVNFLAACIYFFCNWGKEPYDKDGNMLTAEKVQDKQTKRMITTGRVFNSAGEEVEPAYWLGKYSDMPHILSFLNESYQTIFEVLETDNEVAPLLGPFQTALKNKAMEQLEGMIGTLRVYTSRLATKESYWIFHKDGDDFDLKVSDPKNPSYLLIANDPEMESIIGALNALILNRLVTRVNTGQGKNIPVSIIVDELPTLYFHKIDRLIGTARSNKVSVALGFQELPQLEADYGKVGMQKIITTVGNVVSGSARSKETLEWLSSDIFGKVVQLKKGVTIDRDKTSINLNENMDSLVPASKISDMPTGWICGQTARDFVQTKTGSGGSMNIQESEEFKTSKFYCKTDFDMNEIKKEEAGYVPLPKFYTFKSRDERERILYKNFVQVGEDVKEMIQEIQKYKVK
ncbi:type IV secretory system conjugative DNA transfer family protein [Bacteroides muris (ex Afrizal et al. 2022)]|uniref:Type IV secretory system conjugative DNA transfer family protein n=2 Tax=Bacteroides TaxID=816 RepID=A0A4S2AZK3_9BACE|nr:type IV secretory system conjugative DNA transfer family protein [Bacteroides muris (ex Afrizal et al. 2022)]TGY06234.1 type IV secretory system conjugative DNA transfer family protein [Bacteroides muris (ex Afrizal et al. 2022)]